MISFLYINFSCVDLAQSVVDAGALPLLLLCVQEPELPLKRVSAQTLADIARHTPDLAQSLVDAKSVPVLSSFIHSKGNSGASKDVKFMKHLLNCLANISKHSLSLAEAVVDGDILPNVYKFFKAPEPLVKRSCCELLCEIVKHSTALSQLVSQTGGVSVVVDYIANASGSAKVPGIMALGYVVSMNEMLAMSVIVSNGIGPLADSLGLSDSVESDYCKSAACWALGQIGKYSPEHAKHIASKAVLPMLLSIYAHNSAKAAAGHDTPEVIDLVSKVSTSIVQLLSLLFYCCVNGTNLSN